MASRSQAASSSFLLFFGLPFILAGLGVGIVFWGMLWHWYEARSWVEVPCVLESTNLRDHMERRSSGSARDTLMNEAEATYRYSYGGRSYQGTEVSLSLGADNFGDYQVRVSQQLLEARSAGGEFRCFVNPARPEEAILFREGRWTLLLFMSVFPLLFPLVGGLVSCTGWRGKGNRRLVHELQSRHPDEPWRWNPAWAGEWIPPKNRPRPWVWTAVTGWMLLVWGPMLAVLLVDSDVTRENPVSLLGFLPVLPLAVCGLFTLRSWLRAGQPVPQVHVLPMPVLTGGPLKAEVAVPLAGRTVLALNDRLEAELSCHKEWVEVDARRNRSTLRELRWSEKKSVSLNTAVREDRGCRVTVDFDIPASIPAEDLQPIGTAEFDFLSWVWELELRGTAMTQKWRYDMPVYAPHVPLEADSPQAQEAAEAQRERQAAEDAAFQTWQMLNLDADELQMHLARRGIDFTFESRSKKPLSFNLPVRRFGRAQPLLGFFVLLWSGGALALWQPEIPLWVPLLWVGTSLLLLWLFSSLFSSRTLRLDDEGLEAGWKLGPWGKTQRFHREEIRRFIAPGANLRVNREYYGKVKLETVAGEKIVILDALPARRVAESLVLLLDGWRKGA